MGFDSQNRQHLMQKKHQPMKSIKPLSIALLLIILIGLRLHAQNSIQGTLTDLVTGRGVPGAFVKLNYTNPERDATTQTTDRNGIYSFSEVEVGRANLEFREDSYLNRPETREVVLVNGKNSIPTVYLYPIDGDMESAQLAAKQIENLAKVDMLAATQQTMKILSLPIAYSQKSSFSTSLDLAMFSDALPVYNAVENYRTIPPAQAAILEHSLKEYLKNGEMIDHFRTTDPKVLQLIINDFSADLSDQEANQLNLLTPSMGLNKQPNAFNTSTESNTIETQIQVDQSNASSSSLDRYSKQELNRAQLQGIAAP